MYGTYILETIKFIKKLVIEERNYSYNLINSLVNQIRWFNFSSQATCLCPFILKS